MGNARKIAVKLLTRLDDNSAYSNILLDDTLDKSDLSQQEKKFASALFYGVLERRLTLDHIIKEHSKKPADRLNSDIRNILRIGIYQLKFMDSVPDSAAVTNATKLAKKNRNPAVSGFVNGLLRSFIREGMPMPKGKDKLENLSLEYSCPLWLVKKWYSEYGEKVCMDMLESSLGKPPAAIRVNSVFYSAEDTAAILEKDGVSFRKSPLLEDCYTISFSKGAEHTQAYKMGRFHVQDISSQMCCAALEPKENDVVLDLCSAPGGKAFTIAERMNNKGEVHAFDLHDNRVKLINKGAERLGLSIVKAKVNNAKIFNENMPAADKILCDVPCSGLGVIRRKPEIKYKNPEDFGRLPEIQYDILKTSSRYLKAGGILVYSTCTLSKAENDEVADRFLKENSDFEPCALGDAFGGDSHCSRLTITPNKYNSDGFFIAKFKRLR